MINCTKMLCPLLTLLRRHLLRLWLRDPEYAWKTPEVIEWRWKQLYEGIQPEKELLPLEPFVRNAGKGR